MEGAIQADGACELGRVDEGRDVVSMELHGN